MDSTGDMLKWTVKSLSSPLPVVHPSLPPSPHPSINQLGGCLFIKPTFLLCHISLSSNLYVSPSPSISLPISPYPSHCTSLSPPLSHCLCFSISLSLYLFFSLPLYRFVFSVIHHYFTTLRQRHTHTHKPSMHVHACNSVCLCLWES